MLQVTFICDKCGHDKCRLTADYGFRVTADCVNCGHEEEVNKDDE